MIKNRATLSDVSMQSNNQATPTPVRPSAFEDRDASVWVGRITSIIGLICLGLALVEWEVRPGHLRTVLALLTIAMFAAILNSYSFENGA